MRVASVGDMPDWSADVGHTEVIDALLSMAESEHRWGDSPRALHLLNNVERIVGSLPEAYEHLRTRCASVVPAP
jgi:hypothetical protein